METAETLAASSQIDATICGGIGGDAIGIRSRVSFDAVFSPPGRPLNNDESRQISCLRAEWRRADVELFFLH